MARCPIILTSTSGILMNNSAIILAWMGSLGMNIDQIQHVVSKWPKILELNSTNAGATASRLAYLLDFNVSNIVKLITKNPGILGLTPGKLEEKVTWLKSIGLTKKKLQVLFNRLPAVLSRSLDSNKAQFASLQEMSLTYDDAIRMVTANPGLFSYDLGGEIMQAKVCFLTQVMKK